MRAPELEQGSDSAFGRGDWYSGGQGIRAHRVARRAAGMGYPVSSSDFDPVGFGRDMGGEAGGHSFVLSWVQEASEEVNA